MTRYAMHCLLTLTATIGLLLAAPAGAGSYVYEGHLSDGGRPADGRYDLSLTVYPLEKQGASLAAPMVFEDVEVRGGRFRLEFDLPAMDAAQAWLELGVRDGAAEGAFASIPGRSKAIAAPLIGACWSTTGDSGSNPATNFLGTTDNQPLVLRTANARSLRIEPSSVTFGSPALPITTNTIGGSHANEVTVGVRGATIAGGGVPTGNSDPDLAAESPNRVTDHYGTVGGGYANRAGDDAGTAFDQSFATVGGGAGNTASGVVSTVGGGSGNSASGQRSTLGGGQSNTASGNDSTVGGGQQNKAIGLTSTVGGGFFNSAGGDGSTIGGGEANTASGSRSTVGGGSLNSASSLASTVGGGNNNVASGDRSTVGGGFNNTASGGFGSTVSGGNNNTASGNNSTVGGGTSNTASGTHSTVGGGAGNCAGGRLSWAGGRSAKIRPGSNSRAPGVGCSGIPVSGADGDQGTFVWADSTDADFVSTGSNQFLVRASGGMAINTNTPAAGSALTVNGSISTSGAQNFGAQTRQMLNLWGPSPSGFFYGIGVQGGTQYFRADAGGAFAWFAGGAHNDAQFNPGTGGSVLMTLTPGASTSSPTGTARAQSFVNVSDRAAKMAFEAIDVGEVLAQVVRLPLATWTYRNRPEVRHLGPVAQDFHGAFGLGEDDRTISTVDADGVALAAIQGLNQKLEAERDALKAENAELRAESAELRAALEQRDVEYRTRLERLEALLDERLAGGQ